MDAGMTDTIEILRSVMDGQRFAVLATQGAGVPYTNLVAYACSENLRKLYFVTPRDTSKFRNIIENPYVSLFIDNRANRGSDIASAVGISVTGAASGLDDDMKEDLLPLYLERHPYLADFAWAPENALVSVEVARYTIVRNFTQVDVVDPQAFTM